MLNSRLVSWYSKCQTTVTLSLIEAEYIILTLASKVIIWLRLLLIELGLFYFVEQYAEIKVVKENTRSSKIKSSL